MSIPSRVDTKLWKAYGKVAKKLPTATFRVYHPLQYGVNPIQDVYLRGTIQAAITPSSSFETPDVERNKFQICYINPRITTATDIDDCVVGDILYNLVTDSTYIIASMEPHLPITVWKANDRITITRVGYTNVGSPPILTMGEVTIADNIPAQISLSSSGGGTTAYAGTFANSINDTLSRFTIMASLPDRTLQPRDKITDQHGQQLEIQHAIHESWGYNIICKEYNA